MSGDAAAALEAKKRGNAHFSAKEWDAAIKEYSEAISLDPAGPKSHTFFSNRSACFAEKGDLEAALLDGEQCIKLKPDWAKGYSRKGYALFKLDRFGEARATYEEGLKVDPANQALKDGLHQTEQQQQRSANQGIGKLFANVWAVIHQDPELRGYASDPTFIRNVQLLQANPQMAMQSGIMQDPKMQLLFQRVLGMNLGMPPEDGDEAPIVDDLSTPPPEHKDQMPAGGGGARAKDAEEKAPPSKPAPEPEPEPEPEPVDPEVLARLERQAEAAKEKERGNELYKAKQLDEALAAYKRAAELDETKPAYLLNQAAVYVMQEKYEDAELMCEAALVVCRKQRADLKWSYKAYVRMGGIAEKRGQAQQAIDLYKKAMVEQKDDKLRRKVKAMEKKLKKEEEKAYLDEGKALEHRQKGNDFFKEGKWHEAIAEYTESVRRNPNDAKVYNNRATAFSKLMAWDQAEEDCDKALALDPKFLKAWIRKGKINHVLKQYHKALDCYSKAADIDPNVSDLRQARQETMVAIQRRNQSGEVDEQARKRAMDDPIVQEALRDSEVNAVLAKAQSDPSILMKAMRDRPHIADKIQILIAAGVLQVS